MSQRGVRDGKGADGSRLWAKEIERAGVTLKQANRLYSALEKSELYLKQVKFIVKDDEGNDWLVIVTADGTDGPVVSFHGASSFEDALRGLIARIDNGTLKWRPDEYSKS
jgi:hypothetical protein